MTSAATFTLCQTCGGEVSWSLGRLCCGDWFCSIDCWREHDRDVEHSHDPAD